MSLKNVVENSSNVSDWYFVGKNGVRLMVNDMVVVCGVLKKGLIVKCMRIMKIMVKVVFSGLLML